MAQILLAEDSPSDASIISALLQQGAHSVHRVEHGMEALASIEQSMPDLLVTDLMMPKMNGQELTQQIARRFPQLPTIIATSRGNEVMAVEALAEGAADFVPKNSLAKLLPHTVRRTLGIAESDRAYAAFPGELIRPEFMMKIRSNVHAIEPASRLVVQAIAAAHKMNPTNRIRTGIATACALFNSICFGNLDIRDDETLIDGFLSQDESGPSELDRRATESPYCDRRVVLKVSIGEDDTRISVSHDGPGQLAKATPAPGTPESFELEHCRALLLMTSFMDEVVFHNRSTEVVMVAQHR